jgi:hypothetical protein
MSDVELLRAGRLKSEYVGGEWVVPGSGAPQAVVSYAEEPSPETGSEGWVWWAMGDMGESDSFAAALKAAEHSLERRGWRK